ncbi:hypothetical protein HanPSC8_Chr11g0463231 [Helianthus annuus]|nr:hypothetical protein HanPSC8_Chr11g0463231 [Helianthus annuus]
MEHSNQWDPTQLANCGIYQNYPATNLISVNGILATTYHFFSLL